MDRNKLSRILPGTPVALRELLKLYSREIVASNSDRFDRSALRQARSKMKPVQLFCWHFMAYPYLDKDFDQKQYSGWVTVPNSLWDNQRARGLYQEYIDQLAYADELGFDGMVLNEHHQNIYGLMP